MKWFMKMVQTYGAVPMLAVFNAAAVCIAVGAFIVSPTGTSGLACVVAILIIAICVNELFIRSVVKRAR